MQFFRSALLRRIFYAVAIALALMRFTTTRSHSEPLPADDALPRPAIQQVLG